MLTAEELESAEREEAALAVIRGEGVAERDADAQRVEVEEMENVAVLDGEGDAEVEPLEECVTEEDGVPLGVSLGVPDVLGDPVWVNEGVLVAHEEGESALEKVALAEAVPEAHVVPVNEPVPVADTDAEPVRVGDAVADRLYVPLPVMERVKVGEVEPECVTDAEGLSVPEPQDEALLEGEGVPVEEWLTEPERDPCAAEGVDTGEKVAVPVSDGVPVLLTLGEGEEDTVADKEE